jgi:hypothetical protein
MLNSTISTLSTVIYLSSLFFMQWLTTEEKWWSGLIVFVIIARYFGPKSVERFQSTFLEAVKDGKRVRALAASLGMLFLSQGYFLLLALTYYFVMALGVSLSEMAFNLASWGVAGAFFLAKVFGLLIANVLFVPIVCLLSLYVFSRCARTAKKPIDES